MNFLFTFIKSSWKDTRKKIKEFNLPNVKDSQSIDFESKNILIENKGKILDWMAEKVTGFLDINKCHNFIASFNELMVELETYEQLKQEYPVVSFQEVELTLLRMENELFIKYSDVILWCCLGSILSSEFCLVNHLNNKGNLLLLKLSGIVGNIMDEERNTVIESLLEPNLSFLDILRRIDDSILFSDISKQKITKYIQLLIFGVDRPVETNIMGLEKNITSITQLSKQITRLIAKSHHATVNLDFHVTVANLVKSSLVTGRKILNKRNRGDHIPRGIRSKVIYEMYRTAKEVGSSNVQEMAFKLIADLDHDFYGGLAPKAQIGGDRDLLVNETKTKICIHVTESCSKSLMEKSVKNDGLVNKKLKEDILKESINRMELSINKHGLVSHSDGVTTYRIFMKVLCILGDCRKWGPIHCPSFFSLLIQQLLKNFPDWVNYYKLVMLKSILKEIEIPIASIEKVLRSYINNKEAKEELSKLTVDDITGLIESFSKFVDNKWSRNIIVRKLSNWYLCKGRACFQPYNHMGQGIHHATSSLLGNVCATFINDILIFQLKKYFPLLNIEIKHAGSSDDFSKIIFVSGVINQKEFDMYESVYDENICNTINLMTGLMRCCQMMVSEKTIFSDCVAEFYSEFAFTDRVSPSPAKFILNQIINSSVTSPLTLYQSVHVVAQQAMYMGLPFITIFALSLFKQLTFVYNSEHVYRKFGKHILGSLPILGRLYLPKYSQLTNSCGGMDDLQIVRTSLKKLSIAAHNRSKDRRLIKLPDKEGNLLISGWVGTKLTIEEQQDIIDALFIDERDDSFEEVKTVSNATAVSSDNSSQDIEDVSLPTSVESMEPDDKFNISDLLTVLCLKYYSQNNASTYSEGFQSISMTDYQSIFSDPFVQLVPESVRQECDKLREFKKKETMEKLIITDLEKLGMELISQSNLTENYSTEISRLDQALNSKNVVWGLAGGIRNSSISIHRQMMRAYLFENRAALKGIQHWVDEKLSLYINDKKKKVSPERRIKFTDFLDKISSMPIVYEFGNRNYNQNLLESEESCPVSVEERNGKQTIVIVEDKLMSANNLFKGMINELSNTTYITVTSLERTRREGFEPAVNIITKKSSIWIDDKSKVLVNNPNIVAAYFLDPNSIYRAKPTAINFPRVPQDVISLEQNFPKIFETIMKIKNIVKDKLGDDSIYHKYLSVLTNLCRMLTSNRNYKVDLYMFKNLRDSSNENNVNNLMMYSIVEGNQVVFKSKDILQFHNEIVYTIKGCISIINWLRIDDSDKISLLMRLLNMPLKNLLNSVEDCDCQEYIKEEVKKSPDGQITSLLMRESQRSRSSVEAVGLEFLSKLPLGTNRTVAAEANLVSRPTLEWSGSMVSGSFSYSCSFGSAAGLMLNGKLYITLSTADFELFNSLESSILNKLGVSAHEQSTGSSHNQFIKLLPCEEEDGRKPASNQTYYIIPGQGGDISIVRSDSVKGDTSRKKYIMVTGSNIATTYKELRKDEVTSEIKWYRNKLVLGYKVEALKVSIPPSVEKLQDMLNKMGNGEIYKKIQKVTEGRSRFEKLGEVHLPSSVPLSSYSIMHMLLKHPLCLLGKRDTAVSSLHSDISEYIEKYVEENYRDNNDMMTIVENVLERCHQLSDIYSINLLLNSIGFHDVNLIFSGISDKYVNNVGNWKAIFSDDIYSRGLLGVLKSISGLCNNFISRETVQVCLHCNIKSGHIKEFKRFDQLIRNLNIFASTLELFLYLTAKWVAKYIGDLYPNSRDPEYAFLIYLLIKSPISSGSTDLDDYKVYIAPVDGIENLFIETKIDGILMGKQSFIELSKKLKNDNPDLRNIMVQSITKKLWSPIPEKSKTVEECKGYMKTIVKVPIPSKLIISSQSGIDCIFKFFFKKGAESFEQLSLKRLTCFLIKCLCGEGIDIEKLPESLREPMRQTLFKTERLQDEKKNVDLSDAFISAFLSDEESKEPELEEHDEPEELDYDEYGGFD